MQWIRSHLSFANAISMIALFVALGGTSVAAVALTKNSVGAKQIKKNAVRASEIKRNAVRAAEIRGNAVGASEIRSNAVAGGDIADNGVGGADLSDNSVAAGELTDNSVGAGEIGDNAVGSGEITDSSIAVGDLSPVARGPSAFARVQADGTLELGAPPPLTVPQHKGVDQADIQKAGTGIYCFGGLDMTVASAIVSMDNAGATLTTTEVASIAIQRGNTLGNCDADHQQARVVVTDVSPALANPAAVDGRFNVWFMQG